MHRFFWRSLRAKTCYTNALWASVLIVVMLIVPTTYLEACPSCKTLDEPMNKGFNWSILFLMAMPFTVFGLIGGTIFLHFYGFQFSVVSYRLKRVLLPVRKLFTDNRRLPTDNR